MDVASLQVRISTQGVEAAQRELDKLGKNASTAEKSVGGLATKTATLSSSFKNLEKSTKDLITPFTSLRGILLATGALMAAKQFIETTDSMKLLEARIKLVSNATENYASVQKNLNVIANQNGVAIKEIGALYTKLSMSLKPLGVTTNSVMQVTDAFSKTLLISGASIAEASSATQQFAQAMASGRLQGDEFRSMAENSPRFMKAMTDSLGKTSSEIRQMAEDGKLTSSIVGGALIDAMAKLREEARSMPMTVGKAFNELKNEATLTVEQFDKLTGINDSIAKGFQEITKKVIELREELPKMSAAMEEWEKKNEKGLYTLKVVGGAVLDAIATGGGALYEFEKQWFKQSIEGALQTAGTIGEVTGIATDATIKAKKENDILLEGLAKTIKEIEKQAQAIKDAEKDAVAKEEFNNINPTKEQVKAQLKEWEAYHKAIGNIEEALQFKRLRYAEDYKTLNASQIDEMINAERNKHDKTEKLAEDWAKRKIELATETAIAEQDEMSKPYILLQAKYEADLKEFGSQKGAKEDLERKYQAELQKLNQETIKKFEEGLEKEAKKSAEWQVKMLEANEKYNDEIIKMQDEMNGVDTTVEAWYNNQLEYLGKLSQEAGATAEELQTLLDKIEMIKAMKLEKQTISFKVEQSFYNSFEDNLADSIEGAFNGKLNLSSFFKNIGQDVLRTFSGGIANNFTSAMRTGSFATGLSALGLGSTSAAAGDSGGGLLSDLSTLSTIKSLYGLVSNGVGSTVMSGFSGLSNLTGMSGISQFGYGFTNPFASSQLAGLYGSGVPELSGLSSIGSTAGGMALGGLGGYALGSLGDKLFGADTKAGTYGAIGGALGSLGGPIGIAIGTGLGSIIGGLFGSTKQTGAGIRFGSTTGMGQGFDDIQAYAKMKKKSWFSSKSWTDYTDLSSSEIKQIKGIFDTYDFLLTQLGDTDRIILEAGRYTGQSFQDVVAKKFIEAFTDVSQTTDDTIYQAWVDYAESIDKTIIEALSTSINTFISATRTFDVWALNRSGKGIEALAKQAQWAQEDFSNLSNMLGITGVTVENYTEKYREAIKGSFTPETITQWEQLGSALMTATDASSAYATALEQFIKASNYFLSNFDIWSANSSGNTIEGLKIKADYLQTSFSELEKSMGLSGITVDNFKSTYESLAYTNGVINQEMVTDLQSLGTALMTATDAQKAYKTALEQANETIRQNALSILTNQLTSWITALGSIQNAMDNLNPTFKTFSELASQTINLDNYSTLLSQLENTRQNEISKLTETSNLRIAQLEKEKDYFVQIMDYVDELTKRMGVQTTNLGSFFYAELQKAKDNFAKGSDVNISDLNTSASSYLDSVQKNSSTQRDYFLEVAKVRNELSEFGTDLAEGGSLEGIENAILTEQNTLNFQLELLNKTATSLLESWKNTTIGNINTTTGNINTVKNDDITKAYSDILGRTADTAGYEYWNNQILGGNLNSTNIDKAIASASIDEIYKNVLGRDPDEAGKAYWMGQISNGSIKPSDIDEAIKNAAGFSNGGYTGNIGINDIAGVVHGQEYVVNAQTTKDLGLNGSGGAFADMVAELASLRKLMVKLVSDNTKQLSTQRAILGEKVAI